MSVVSVVQTPVVQSLDELRDATLLALTIHAEEMAREVMGPLAHVIARHGGVEIERESTRVVAAFGLDTPTVAKPSRPRGSR